MNCHEVNLESLMVWGPVTCLDQVLIQPCCFWQNKTLDTLTLEHTNMSFGMFMHTCGEYPHSTLTQLFLCGCSRPPINTSSLWTWLPCSRVTGNYPLYESQFHLIQDYFLNITALFLQYGGELQSKSCWRKDRRPAVWQKEVGVTVERINAFHKVTFLQNNCPIMTASSRVLCKGVSHFSWLCAVASGGVKKWKIF